MKLNNKIAIAGVIVAIISIVVTFSSNKKEKLTKLIESNTMHQTTHGNGSPIINTEKDVNINY